MSNYKSAHVVAHGTRLHYHRIGEGEQPLVLVQVLQMEVTDKSKQAAGRGFGLSKATTIEEAGKPGQTSPQSS